jgi:hypothetical protein
LAEEPAHWCAIIITKTESSSGPASVDLRISAALADADKPRTFAELRASCRVRTTTLYQRLAAMTADGIVIKSADGYRLAIR